VNPFIRGVLKAARGGREGGQTVEADSARGDGGEAAGSERVRPRGGSLKFSKRSEPEKRPPYSRLARALLFLSFNPWVERLTLYSTTRHRGSQRAAENGCCHPSRAHVCRSLSFSHSHFSSLARSLSVRALIRARSAGVKPACLDNTSSARCARRFVVLAAATPDLNAFSSREALNTGEKKKKYIYIYIRAQA